MVKDAGTTRSEINLGTLCASGLDAIVIGAGVGGAAAALHLIRQLGPSAHVLLVERSAWPRTKVCGCCLNHAALALLDELEIASNALDQHAQVLTRVEVRCGKRAAHWKIPQGLAISRAILDNMLVQNAISAGVVFLAQCGAKVITDRSALTGNRDDQHPAHHRVVLRTSREEVECSPRMIIVADGLAGSSLDALPEFRTQIQPSSWIGLGGAISARASLPASTINMNIGAHGYVGLVRLNDGLVNLASAVDPAWVKSIGGPERATRTILQSCGVNLTEHTTQPWSLKGTPMLTRRRPRVASPGLLVIGDAASYVEPFTGEGMTWALASAKAAAGLAALEILHGNIHSAIVAANAWQHWHDSTIAHRQLTSRLLRALTHRPPFARFTLSLLSRPPGASAIAAAIATRLSVPYPEVHRIHPHQTFPGAAA